MLEFVIAILILMIALVAFNLEMKRSLKAKREVQRRAESERILRPNDAESRTIDLIGEQAYDEMTRNIDEILRRHGHQKCISFDLTCGPDTLEGSDRLHRLLPGTPLQLMLCSEGGVDWVDVYDGGARIGRLALLEAAILKETMRTNHLRAAYVAEQNCFGIEDSHQLSVIVFYDPKEVSKPHLTEVFARKPETEPGTLDSKHICPN